MIETPKETMDDSLHLTAKVALSSLPILGGPVLELFNSILLPPIEKRRQKWMEEITDAVNELIENNRINIIELKNNEQFISTILQASSIVIKNHKKEKIEALKNAVINSALEHSLEDSLQQMFLGFIEYFTVYHIKLLTLFQNPEKWFRDNNKAFPNVSAGGLSEVIHVAFPELRSKREEYDLIWSDLHSRGLTRTSGLHVTMSAYGLKEKRITDLGDKFLTFISRSY